MKINFATEPMEVQEYNRSIQDVNMDYFWFLTSLHATLESDTATVKIASDKHGAAAERVASIEGVVLTKHEMGDTISIDLAYKEDGSKDTQELPLIHRGSVKEQSLAGVHSQRYYLRVVDPEASRGEAYYEYAEPDFRVTFSGAFV